MHPQNDRMQSNLTAVTELKNCQGKSFVVEYGVYR